MNNSVKNLEKLVESSLRIKKLISDKSEVKETKTINLPLSSMIKVGTNIFNNRFSDITESEKKELNNLLSMDKKTLEAQINESKKNVIEKLKSTLNESEDKELHNKIHNTIEKINDSEISFLTLYRIKELEKEI
jgi:Pyruvate/2-oxoacid:ferredoxin oxidoreductase gamma subunit